MRAFKLALSILLLSSLPLFARDVPTISSISPNTIYANSGEWFITLHGTHYLPTTGVVVIFSGPAGTLSLAPSAATDTSIEVWVPAEVILAPGFYSVKVRVPNGASTLDSNSATFRVVGTSVLLQVPTILLSEALSRSGAVAQFEVSAISQLGDQTYIECSHKSGELFPMGVTTVDCYASDEFGGEAKESFNIQVSDTTPPSLNTPRELVLFGKSDGGPVTYDVKADDLVDGEVKPLCAPESGSIFRVGTTTVSCSASDSFKNKSTGTFRVHIGDEETPALIVPEVVIAEAASVDGATVSFDATGTSSNGEPAKVDCDPKSGSLFRIGTTTVKCTAVGPTGKSWTEAFDVRVADTTAPELSLPKDFSDQASMPEGAYVRFFASAKDSVEGETFVACYPASGSLFAPGATAVNCSSSDKSGNASTGSFVITVAPWVDETDLSRTDEGSTDGN